MINKYETSLIDTEPTDIKPKIMKASPDSNPLVL